MKSYKVIREEESAQITALVSFDFFSIIGPGDLLTLFFA